MTTTSAISPLDLDSDKARAKRTLLPVAAFSFVVTAVFTALGVFVSAPGVERHHASEFWGVMAVVAVATILIFGFVVRSGLQKVAAGGRGIAMAVAGLLILVPAFWSGLPMILGSASALLGYAGKRSESGAGRAMAAFGLGLLACVGYVAICVGDYLHTHGVG